MYIIGKEEVEAVQRVIDSKQLFRYRGGEGGESEQFESEWSKKIGVKHTTIHREEARSCPYSESKPTKPFPKIKLQR